VEQPDYMVCVECESPCYTFEFQGKIVEIVCMTCGNEDLELFATPDEFEEMTSAPSPGRKSGSAAPSSR
jgi:hypothetical protein